MSLISPDMTIETILSEFPKFRQKMTALMESYGLHCVGCSANIFESLRQGVLGHGLGEDVLEQIVTGLNKIVQETQNAQKPFKIFLTDRAVERIRELSLQEVADTQFFRVSVVPGGCAGVSYDVNFVQKAEDDDCVLKEKDLTILIEKNSMDVLNGLEIDFEKTLLQSSFKFKNPNAKGECGCGTSFDFEDK